MIAKIWKKLGLFILIVLCLFNIISKLVVKLSFSDEINTTKDYVKSIKNEIV